MTTSSEVARAAGVSQATVSRVLNDDPRVAAATRARVLSAIKRLNYTPNAIARGLVTRRTGIIGVVVANIMNPFYPEFLEAIADRLAESQLKMLLFNASGQPEEEYIRVLLEQQVEGVVFTSATCDSRLVQELADRRFPAVLTNRYIKDIALDAAVGDNEGGARAVADHLLTLGHERIGVIAGDHLASTSNERLAAFRAALHDAGRAIDDDLVRQANFDPTMARDCARDLLDRPDRPTAIFCLNDLMAFGVLNAVRGLGLRVPDDVSVVGFDDIWMAGWESFRLTTVHQPLAEMARAAVDLLIERLNDPHRSVRKLVFPSALVVRETTTSLAATPSLDGSSAKRRTTVPAI